MSEQSIAIVRATIDAINRRDWDTALQHASPDFEYDLTRTVSPLAGVHSLAQARRVIEEFLSPWEDYRYEVHEVIEAGDHVVTPFTTHFRGRDGLDVEAHATWVWTIRGGALMRVCLYQDRDEALEAAGFRRDS